MLRVSLSSRLRWRVAVGAAAVLVSSLLVLGVDATSHPAAAASGGSTLAGAGQAFACETGFYAVAAANVYRGNPATGDWTQFGTNPGGTFNALGYNPVDNHLYGIQGNRHLLRIDADGTVTDLGDIGLPAGTYNKGTFDELGQMWVGNYPNYQVINVDALTFTTVVASGGSATLNLIADYAYYDGTLVVLNGSTPPTVTRIDITPASPDYGKVVFQSAPVQNFPSILFPNSVNSVWSSANGQLFFGNATNQTWEIIDPYGSAPQAVLRATIPNSGSGDGANCYTALPPWGIEAGDDDFTGTPIISSAGGVVGSVFGNDHLFQSTDPLTAGGTAPNVTVTLLDDGLSGAIIGDDGTVTVPAGVAPGTYTLEYQICEVGTPSSCDTAHATFVVLGEGVDDTANIGPSGGSAVVDVIGNDRTAIPGVTLDPTSVVLRHPDATNGGKNLTIAGVGTWQVDAVTGAVTVTPVAGFVGTTPEIQYGIQGDDGNVYVAGLTVTVQAPTAPVNSVPGNPGPGTGRAANGGTLPVTGMDFPWGALTTAVALLAAGMLLMLRRRRMS